MRGALLEFHRPFARGGWDPEIGDAERTPGKRSRAKLKSGYFFSDFT